MRYDAQPFEILENTRIADGIFDMRVKNDVIAPLAVCGQFAHVYVPSKLFADLFPSVINKTEF